MRAHGQTRMDVAVAIGADPVSMYSAILPLPPDLDEMMIAGFLRQSPVEMVKCQTCDLEVPAQAEIVLEGYVELASCAPKARSAITPVFIRWKIVPGLSPYCHHAPRKTDLRDHHRGAAAHGRLLHGQGHRTHFPALMRLQLPEVRDIAMPAEGIFHNLILVSIRKSYPGHARKVMHSIWGTGQAMFSKVIVVVDEDVDVQNSSEVAWKALNNIDPERDIEFVMGRSIRSIIRVACRLRFQDGNRRHPQVAHRGLHAAVARADRNVRRH